MRQRSIIVALAALLSTVAAQSYTPANVRITFYSYVDNTDADDGDCTANCNDGGENGTLQLAHQCDGRSGLAGGVGDEDSPITAASAGDGPVAVCDKFYVPYLQKWFIYEDYCTDCADDPPHFDLFAGGSPDNNLCPNICACEDQLTPSSSDICIFTGISDGGGLQVSSSALYDGLNCNFSGSSASSC